MHDRGKPVAEGSDATLMVNTESGLRPVESLGREEDPNPEPAEESKTDPEKTDSETKMADQKPEPKPKPKPTTRTPNARTPKPRKAGSEEAVLSRAKRMTRSRLKKVWEAIGKGEEPFDEAALDAELENLIQAREDQMGDRERIDARMTKLEEQNADLRAKIAAANAAKEKAERDAADAQRQRENLEVEYEIRGIAQEVGIRDTDYGLHLFRGHVNELGEDGEPDPRAFFEGLKSDNGKRHLFKEEEVRAGPPPLAQDQGASPQGQSGNPQPQPKPQGASEGRSEPDNVLDLNRRDFNQRTADKYGFRPGMA